jgi:hypothetical protein
MARKKLPPTTPGEVLLEEFLKPLEARATAQCLAPHSNARPPGRPLREGVLGAVGPRCLPPSLLYSSRQTFSRVLEPRYRSAAAFFIANPRTPGSPSVPRSGG